MAGWGARAMAEGPGRRRWRRALKSWTSARAGALRALAAGVHGSAGRGRRSGSGSGSGELCARVARVGTRERATLERGTRGPRACGASRGGQEGQEGRKGRERSRMGGGVGSRACTGGGRGGRGGAVRAMGAGPMGRRHPILARAIKPRRTRRHPTKPATPDKSPQSPFTEPFKPPGAPASNTPQLSRSTFLRFRDYNGSIAFVSRCDKTSTPFATRYGPV